MYKSDQDEAVMHGVDCCTAEVQFPLLWDNKWWCGMCLAEEFTEEVMDASLEYHSVEWAESHAPDAQDWDSEGDGAPICIYVGEERIPFDHLLKLRNNPTNPEWTPDQWERVAGLVGEAQKDFHEDMEAKGLYEND